MLGVIMVLETAIAIIAVSMRRVMIGLIMMMVSIIMIREHYNV